MKKLFAEHHQWALRVATRVVGNAFDAEDIVSEVFLSMSKAFAGGRALPENPRAYLRRAIQNEATRTFARHQREITVAEVPDAPAVETVEAAVAVRVDRARTLAAHPAMWTALLYNVDVLGLSTTEAASGLGMTTSSANSMLHRARHAIAV